MKAEQRYNIGECVVLGYGDDESFLKDIILNLFLSGFTVNENTLLLPINTLLLPINTSLLPSLMHYNCYEAEKSGYFEIADVERLYD